MAGRWFGLIVIAIIGVLLGGGFRLFQTINPFTDSSQQNRPAVEMQRPPESKTPETTPSTEEPPQAPKTVIAQAKPDQGEIVVEGMVDSISVKKRSVKFTQEMDDTSKKVNPRVQILQDAVIEVNGKITDLDQLLVGDYVTMILNSKGQARAIQIDR
ncbi:MAG: hypothetical protein ACYC0N_01600 [Carboxydocellales bacterium]